MIWVTQWFGWPGRWWNQTPAKSITCRHWGTKISVTAKWRRIAEENHHFTSLAVSGIRKIRTVDSSVWLWEEEQTSGDLVTERSNQHAYLVVWSVIKDQLHKGLLLKGVSSAIMAVLDLLQSINWSVSFVFTRTKTAFRKNGLFSRQCVTADWESYKERTYCRYLN